MKRRHIIYLNIILLLTIGTACEKEIDFTYRDISPIPVIEAFLTNDSSRVHISTTRNMDEPRNTDTAIKHAEVKLLEENGTTHSYHWDEETKAYIPSGTFPKQTEQTYTLNVSFDRKTYTSKAKMLAPINPQAVMTKFMWKEFAEGVNMLFASIMVMDTQPDVVNHYRYSVYLNEKLCQQNILRDAANDAKFLSILIPFIPHKSLGFNSVISDAMSESESESMGLLQINEDDILSVHIEEIDMRTYDYLYSLSISSSESANPISNFTEGALGYFSAYSTITTQTEFKLADVIK